MKRTPSHPSAKRKVAIVAAFPENPDFRADKIKIIILSVPIIIEKKRQSKAVSVKM